MIQNQMRGFYNTPKVKYLHKDAYGIRLYELKGEFKFITDGKIITVPKGFQTNYASIPKMFHFMFKPQNRRYSKSSVLHDYLYSTDTTYKVYDDWIYKSAMKREQKAFRKGVSRGITKDKKGFKKIRKLKMYLKEIPLCFFIRWVFWLSVSCFGFRYKKNCKILTLF